MPLRMKNPRLGFTLIEVIFSLLILSIGLLGIFQGQSGATKVIIRSEAMAQALNIAEEKMTEIEIQLKNKSFISLPEEEKGEPKEEKLKQFKWVRKLEKVEMGCLIPEALFGGGNSDKDDKSGAGGAAAGLGGIPTLVKQVFETNVRKIIVIVEWSEGNQKKSVELTQLYVRFKDFPSAI